ncbi:MAG: hypothetical protein H6621_09605 [Halobacteriovoraceae bacterium]|nr:hypothetical protein [Halobacteriovoraceae bacterium]MCB9095312.1 hypothetical protein [Halobacteriovoraceae bacterium]
MKYLHCLCMVVFLGSCGLSTQKLQENQNKNFQNQGGNTITDADVIGLCGDEENLQDLKAGKDKVEKRINYLAKSIKSIVSLFNVLTVDEALEMCFRIEDQQKSLNLCEDLKGKTTERHFLELELIRINAITESCFPQKCILDTNDDGVVSNSDMNDMLLVLDDEDSAFHQLNSVIKEKIQKKDKFYSKRALEDLFANNDLIDGHSLNEYSGCQEAKRSQGLIRGDIDFESFIFEVSLTESKTQLDSENVLSFLASVSEKSPLLKDKNAGFLMEDFKAACESLSLDPVGGSELQHPIVDYSYVITDLSPNNEDGNLKIDAVFICVE